MNSQGYSSYFDAVSNCYVGMGRCRPHLKKKRRLPLANRMSLACAIGQFVRPLVEVKPGSEEIARWMPLDESVKRVEYVFVAMLEASTGILAFRLHNNYCVVSG